MTTTRTQYARDEGGGGAGKEDDLFFILFLGSDEENLSFISLVCLFLTMVVVVSTV